MLRVYGIGNPLIDLNYTVDDDDLRTLGLDKGIMHLVDEARRDLILGHLGGRPLNYTPGGDVPNTIINLGMLGVPVALSGKIGQDEFGRMYEERIQACGVQSDLGSGPGKTGSSIILVSPDGERTMNTYLGMCQEYGQGDVNRQLLTQADYLYFSGYCWDTQNQKDAISFAVSVAAAAGKAIAFDLADPFAVGRYRDDFLWLLERYVDIAFANADEVRLLFQDQDLQSCVAKLAKLSRICAVKDGERGSYVALDGAVQHVPARKVAVRDTTGAGDSYAAGFLYGLLAADPAKRGNGCLDLDCQDAASVLEAGRIAGHLAATVITRHGTQLSAAEAATLQADLAAGRHRA